MSITREQIEERKNVLQNDIITARERMAEYDKKKTEDVALLNALTGAYHQCENFLKDLDNASGDDGNDKEE